jgi:hypothetical protein
MNKENGQPSLLRLALESNRSGSYLLYVKFTGAIPARVRLDIDVSMVSSSLVVAQEEQDRRNMAIIVKELADLRKVVDLE